MNEYQYSFLSQVVDGVVRLTVYSGLIYMAFWCADKFGLIQAI